MRRHAYIHRGKWRTQEAPMLKFLASTVGILSLIGLLVVIGILALIF
jgi:hypothetical protein